jgi:hypothetical protein
MYGEPISAFSWQQRTHIVDGYLYVNDTKETNLRVSMAKMVTWTLHHGTLHALPSVFFLVYVVNLDFFLRLQVHVETPCHAKVPEKLPREPGEVYSFPLTLSCRAYIYVGRPLSCGDQFLWWPLSCGDRFLREPSWYLTVKCWKVIGNINKNQPVNFTIPLKVL